MKRLYQLLATIALWSPDVLLGQVGVPMGREFEEPVLVVFHAPAPAQASARVLREELAAFARAHAGALVDVSPKPPAPPRARELLHRGLAAYRAFEYDEAIEHLDAGLSEAERTGGAGLSAAELADLHLARALVLSQLGQDEQAWDEMVAAATLDVTRILDPVRFPPRVIESFARASAALRAGDFSQFVVNVDDDCQTFLDGRAVTPGEARPVPLGQHYLRVSCPGHEDYGARVQVQSAEQVHAPALRSHASPDDASLYRLARTRGARSLLVVQVIESPDAPPSASLRWLDVDSGRARGRVTANLPHERDAREAVRAIDRFFQDRARRSIVPPTDRPMKQSTPWHRRPWVWAAIGAAAATVALSPLVFDSSPSRGFIVRPSGDVPRM